MWSVRLGKGCLVIVMLVLIIATDIIMIGNSNSKEETPYNSSTSCLSSCMATLVSTATSWCHRSPAVKQGALKVLSYSFYGGMESEYYSGISENLADMKIHYPGWVLRLHIDSQRMTNINRIRLCNLQCQEEGRLELCPVNNAPVVGDVSRVMGMTWRFLPMTDPAVDILVSRDLDSRLTGRERSAVAEWLSTSLPFHVMRDHPLHQVEIT